MSKFLIRRLSLALLIFFMGVFVSYSVIRMMPSSYVETKARNYQLHQVVSLMRVAGTAKQEIRLRYRYFYWLC